MIVERVSGRPLDELTRELFAELDCTDTYYNPLQYRDKRNCLPTETDYILGRGTVQGYVHDELGALMGGVGGNAGLFTTARDMARFCEMILGGGTYAGRQVLTRKTVELLRSRPIRNRAFGAASGSISGARKRAVGRRDPFRPYRVHQDDFLDGQPDGRLHGFPDQCRAPDPGEQQAERFHAAYENLGNALLYAGQFR